MSVASGVAQCAVSVLAGAVLTDAGIPHFPPLSVQAAANFALAGVASLSLAFGANAATVKLGGDGGELVFVPATVTIAKGESVTWCASCRCRGAIPASNPPSGRLSALHVRCARRLTWSPGRAG